MHHLRFFILLFAVSSLLFPFPSEAFAAIGDITAVKTQSLGNNLEHADGFASNNFFMHNSLVKVDADTYALAHAGADGDGFISTFTISADGSTITEVATLEHDTVFAKFNSLVKVDDDTYALAYASTASNGFFATFTISAAGDITAVKTQTLGNNLSTGQGGYNSLVQVDADTYALAHQGGQASISGFISTYTISADGSTITGVASLEHDTDRGSHNSLVKVDDDAYVLAYTGVSPYTGFISTFTISAAGDITAVKTQSEGNNLEHDTVFGADNSLVQVDADTYALAYSGDGYAGNDGGFISTFTISPATTPSKVGTVTPTPGNTQVALSWSAPATGGAAITDYIPQYSTDDSNWSTFSDGTSTSTTVTVTGLTNGTLYYFKVAAVNSAGTGYILQFYQCHC